MLWREDVILSFFWIDPFLCPGMGGWLGVLGCPWNGVLLFACKSLLLPFPPLLLRNRKSFQNVWGQYHFPAPLLFHFGISCQVSVLKYIKKKKSLIYTKKKKIYIYTTENSSLSTRLYKKKKKKLSLFQNLHLSLYLSLLPLLACTYLNNAWDLVLLALPLYVCLFKINRFMYSPIVSRFG